MSKTILIIGGGIAGLAAGIYGQLNGYKTEVFEQHRRAGGLCTAWNRNGYSFDGCIHHLAGAGPASPLYQIWQELGIFHNLPMTFLPELVQIQDTDGQALIIYSDLDRLQQHLLALAPVDEKVITKYLQAARQFLHLDLLAFPLYGTWDKLQLLPKTPNLLRWFRTPVEDFADRFSSPLLRHTFPLVQYGFAQVPMAIHLSFLAGCHKKTLGWPRGGSQAFVEAMEKRYRELGGQIHYGTPVEEIVVENNRALGIRLKDGAGLEKGDMVISAADGHSTIYGMLGGRYTTREIDTYYTQAPQKEEMSLHVSLGINRDLSDYPHALTFLLPEPAQIGGQEMKHLTLNHYAFDPTMAPTGKTAAKVFLPARFGYWQTLLERGRAEYEEEKALVAEQVLKLLDRHIPGLAAAVETVDVATPLTIQRYTGNYEGHQAWWPEGANMMKVMAKGLSRTLPGLENFYMTGQWAGAMVGLSTAALSSRGLLQAICKRDGKRFSTGD